MELSFSQVNYSPLWCRFNRMKRSKDGLFPVRSTQVLSRTGGRSDSWRSRIAGPAQLGGHPTARLRNRIEPRNRGHIAVGERTSRGFELRSGEETKLQPVRSDRPS